MRRDGRTRRESWLLLVLGSLLYGTVIFLSVTRENASETLIVTLLTFATVLVGVPLPDIVRPKAPPPSNGADKEGP